MAARVLSTEQAKSAITQVQAIINGGLTEQITKLDAQGKILSSGTARSPSSSATRRGPRRSPRSTRRTPSSTSCRRSPRTS